MWRISYKHFKHKKRRFIQCLLRARTKKFILYYKKRKPANKKSSVFLKKISKIRFDILCITFKPPEMPALKVVI